CIYTSDHLHSESGWGTEAREAAWPVGTPADPWIQRAEGPPDGVGRCQRRGPPGSQRLALADRVAVVGVENSLPKPKARGGHFDQLVILDEVERLLQRQRAGRGQGDGEVR